VEDTDTYYEQVPVAQVKKIVELLPGAKRDEKHTVASIQSSVNLPSREAWQELAKLAQQETDPKKMIDLVQQLIEKYDQEKTRTVPSRASKPMDTSPAP
jgi:hypothetical protein